MLRPLALLVLSLVSLAAPAAGQGDLVEMRTRVTVGRWSQSRTWTARALLLLSLGEHWHPTAAPLFVEALGTRKPELRAFAVESLLRSHPVSLRSGLTREVLDLLVRRELGRRDTLLRQRVLAVLGRCFPYAEVEKPAHWRKWWEDERDDYRPLEWMGGPSVESEGPLRSSAELYTRVLDLAAAELELVLCLDTTSSMQPAIDAVGRGLRDMVSVLGGIVPELRVGLVHYRDFGDLEDAAEVLKPLTERAAMVERILGKLVAEGGGDRPERVEAGLRQALSKRVGWSREANKIVLVVGDAPFHSRGGEVALEIARSAHRRPFGAGAAELEPVSGKRPRVRPWVVSAIGVGLHEVSPRTRQAFQELAESGGGRYGEYLTAELEDPRRDLLAEVLALCLRCEAEQLEDFLDVYLAYLDAGVF